MHSKLALLLIVIYISQPTMAIRAGYWPSDLNSTFPASSIEFSLFSHVYYAFLQPDPTNFALVPTPFDSSALPFFSAAAHAACPPVKTMLSIGGDRSNSTTFAALAGNKANRATFISSTVAVARQFGFDGLDLDWQFPQDPQQMANLGSLVEEWRAIVDAEAATSGQPKLLLSAAVYYASRLTLDGIARSYPAETMGSNLDWISPMCYDFHGAWDTSQTGAPAALFDPKSNISTSYGIGSWISAGVPSTKVVMGIPLYGHSWELQNPCVNGIGAPAVAVGPGLNGIKVFSEIVDYNVQNNATVVYDGTTVSTYSYAGTTWIGYDDEKSTAAKIQFAKAQELGGYFFWALGYDDKNWSVSKTASDAWGASYGAADNM